MTTLSEIDDIKTAKEILQALCQYQNIELTYSEAKEALNDIDDKVIDSCGEFWFKLDSFEFRVINDSDIQEIWTDSLIQQVKDCYDFSAFPDFVVIDWEKTADACKVDGMGHHFSCYDHSEHSSNSYYYFLINA